MRKISFFFLLLLSLSGNLVVNAQDVDICDNVDAIVEGLTIMLESVEEIEDLTTIGIALQAIYEQCDIPFDSFTTSDSSTVSPLELDIGYGYESDFWQVYFTAPLNTRNRSEYVGGIDVPLADAINATQSTLDIAAFEFNNPVITEAVLDAHERGVIVRVITDDEHGIEDDDSTLPELELAGIPIVNDGRSALMHNKFMIMDGKTVWTGSMNYTVNGVYRNNNNVLVLRSPAVAAVYQAEFDEMFSDEEFGPGSDDSNTGDLTENGTDIEIYFASENDVISAILDQIESAETSIHFMTFSFTRDDMGDALLEQAEAGIDVQGINETIGSETQFAELPRLFCAGVDVRQDGNSGILHHKAIIIDSETVITGSFNFSNNAVASNDENLVIIHNADIAALYLDEFIRLQAIAIIPDDIVC